MIGYLLALIFILKGVFTFGLFDIVWGLVFGFVLPKIGHTCFETCHSEGAPVLTKDYIILEIKANWHLWVEIIQGKRKM